MECPNCNKELATLPEASHCHLCGHQLPEGDKPAGLLTCSSCQQPLLPAAKYCHQCGQNLLEADEPAPTKTCSSCGAESQEEFKFCPECGEFFRNLDAADVEPGQRVACADGMCIGIIGSDGKCTECGKPHKG